MPRPALSGYCVALAVLCLVGFSVGTVWWSSWLQLGSARWFSRLVASRIDTVPIGQYNGSNLENVTEHPIGLFRPVLLQHKGQASARRMQGTQETRIKEECELNFWNELKKKKGGSFGQNLWFEDYYVKGFQLSRAFYAGKKILDIGCGPQGSLEWARGIALQTVCADPLANEYSALGAWNHSMLYLAAGVEKMPIAEHSIDIVTSINNFDHIINAEAGIREILRVLRPGGYFMIIVECHPTPTTCEPRAFGWNFHEMVVRGGFKMMKSRYHLNPEGAVHSKTGLVIYEEGLRPEQVRNMNASKTGWFVGIFEAPIY